MSSHRTIGNSLVTAFLIAVLPALLVQVAGAEFTETMSLEAGSLRVNNLIGEIQVVSRAGLELRGRSPCPGEGRDPRTRHGRDQARPGGRGLGEVPAQGKHQIRLPEARARLPFLVHGQSPRVGGAR